MIDRRSQDPTGISAQVGESQPAIRLEYCASLSPGRCAISVLPLSPPSAGQHHGLRNGVIQDQSAGGLKIAYHPGCERQDHSENHQNTAREEPIFVLDDEETNWDDANTGSRFVSGSGNSPEDSTRSKDTTLVLIVSSSV